MDRILDASFRHRFFEAVDVEMAIGTMMRLERLDISHNEIERPPRLPPSLISLNLSHNPACQQMAGLAVSSLMNLRELIITNNALTSTHGLSHLTSLEVLNIAENSIEKLSGLEMLSRLKILILVHNEISNVIALRCLSCNDSLESIDLRGNPVCDAPNYATVRNMIGESLREMDGRLIKAKRFPTNKAAHTSAKDDNTYLHYAAGNAVPPNANEDVNSSFETRAKYTSIEDRASPEKFKVLRRQSIKTTKGSSNPISKRGVGAVMGRAEIPSSYAGSTTGTVSSGGVTPTSSSPQPTPSGNKGGGYSAQYQAHGAQMQGGSAVPSHSPGKQISVAGGLHMKPQYHAHAQAVQSTGIYKGRGSQSSSTSRVGFVTGREVVGSPESEGDDEDALADQYVFNGDGSPRGKRGRRGVNSARSEDSTTSLGLGMGFNITHSHTSYYQNTAGAGGVSHMLRNFHLQKKSPLPWRNAPSVKPRPWKGVLVYDSLGGRHGSSNDDEWVPVVSEQGKHMENDAEWVSPVTIAAYARDRRNVSNKNVYKVAKEGMAQPYIQPEVRGPGKLTTARASTNQYSNGSSRISKVGSPSRGGDNGGGNYYSAASILPVWVNNNSEIRSALSPGDNNYSAAPEEAVGSPSSLEYSLSRSMDEDKAVSYGLRIGKVGNDLGHDKYQRKPMDQLPSPPSQNRGARASKADAGSPLSPTGDPRNTSTGSNITAGSSDTGGNKSPRHRHYQEATFSAYTKTSPARRDFMHSKPSLHSPGEAYTGSPRNGGGASPRSLTNKSNRVQSRLSALERLALSDDPTGASVLDQYAYVLQDDEPEVSFVSGSASEEGGLPRNGYGGADDDRVADESALSVNSADIFVSNVVKLFPPAAPDGADSAAVKATLAVSMPAAAKQTQNSPKMSEVVVNMQPGHDIDIAALQRTLDNM